MATLKLKRPMAEWRRAFAGEIAWDWYVSRQARTARIQMFMPRGLLAYTKRAAKTRKQGWGTPPASEWS